MDRNRQREYDRNHYNDDRYDRRSETEQRFNSRDVRNERYSHNDHRDRNYDDRSYHGRDGRYGDRHRDDRDRYYEHKGNYHDRDAPVKHKRRSPSPQRGTHQSHRSRSSRSPSTRTFERRHRSPSPVTRSSPKTLSLKDSANKETPLEPLDEIDPNDPEAIAAALGFSGFGSTKGSHVPGNDVSAAHIKKEKKYRQYMNRSRHQQGSTIKD